MSRGLVAVLILGVLVLAGCSEPLGRERVTGIDRQRLQVMLDEPIIRNANQDVNSQPGTLLTADTWARGSVSASVSSTYPDERGTPAPPEQTERRTAEALGVLRASGGTITSASCEVPEPDAGSGEGSWAWTVTGYKHVDGVSYWATLTGAAVRAGLGLVDVTLRAPNVDDPPDLFADRPAGLPAGSTCIEQPGIPAEDVAQGSPVQLGPVGPPALTSSEPAR